MLKTCQMSLVQVNQLPPDFPACYLLVLYYSVGILCKVGAGRGVLCAVPSWETMLVRGKHPRMSFAPAKQLSTMLGQHWPARTARKDENFQPTNWHKILEL